MNDDLIPAIIFYLTFLGLFYLVGAIALILWRLVLVPVIVYLSNKRYQEQVINQRLFYNQTKLILIDN